MSPAMQTEGHNCVFGKGSNVFAQPPSKPIYRLMLHVLSIALNRYHERSGVSALQGCEADSLALQGFVQRTFPHLLDANGDNLHRLWNEQATRDNVIAAFSEHLIARAQAGDTVLLHYSGHGSFQATAPEFRIFDQKIAQDETLVCYDSRLPGGYDLADKEIAALLSQLPAGVEAVVIADSCHSGTITRDANALTPRFFSGRKDEARPLASYLDGFYTRRPAGAAFLPESQHILLAACDRDERAYERGGRGLFTQHLISALAVTGGRVTYTELFQRLRASISSEQANQNPQFEVSGNFNANRYFLASEQRRSRTYLVHWKNQAWQLDAGAVHGLPTNAADRDGLRIALRDLFAGELSAPVQTAKPRAVLLNHSVLELDLPDTSRRFEGEISSVPSPIIACLLAGDPAAVAVFAAQFRAPTPFFCFTSQTEKADYALIVNEMQSANLLRAELRRPADAVLLQAVEGAAADVARHCAALLAKVEHWERIRQVENPDSRLFTAGQFSWQIETADAAGHFEKTSARALTLHYDGQRKVPFRIAFSNRSGKELWLYLLQFSRQYGIWVFPPGGRQAGAETDSVLHEGQFFIADDALASYSIFKLLASTRPVDQFLFQQEPIRDFGKTILAANTRDVDTSDPGPGHNFEDWFVENIRVDVLRR